LAFAFLLISQNVSGQHVSGQHISPSTEISNLPIIGYNPQTGARVGLALNMVFYPKPGKNQSHHNLPSVIRPMIAYGFKNKQVITSNAESKLSWTDCCLFLLHLF